MLQPSTKPESCVGFEQSWVYNPAPTEELDAALPSCLRAFFEDLNAKSRSRAAKGGRGFRFLTRSITSLSRAKEFVPDSWY